MARSRQRTIVSTLNSEASKPLSDASNRPAGPSPPKSKPADVAPAAVTAAPPAPAARHPTPPPLPAAAEALLLPGLEEDGLPGGGAFQMPLPADSSEAAAFGNVFADSLRITSISRSAPARRQNKLRQVVQADDAEGRRLSRMPPQDRAVVRARTVPLQEKRRQPRAAQRSAVAEATEAADALPPADSPAAAHAEAAEEAPLPVEPGATAAPVHTSRSSAESSGESCAQGVEVPADGVAPVEAEAPAACAAPAEAAEGKAAEDEEEEEEEAAAPVTRANSSEHRSHPAAEAVYAGVPADVEAAAMSGTPAPPAWLQQQGVCHSEPGTRMEYNQPMAMHNQHAAAVWRSMWLSGLQWHNACRAGHPIRAGSPWAFIPLDPNEPLLELFMYHTSVMPEHVIAGAARFQDILLGDPQLHAAAMEAGVFSFGVWGVPSAAGGYSLLEGGRTLALPVTLRTAPPQTVALFLACVWHEANRAETAQHASYTFGAGGERMADERMLKYPLTELRQWVRLAVGGSKRFAEDLLAALAHLSCFGIE